MYTTHIPAHRDKSRQALSGRRESRYERSPDVGMSPEEFFDTRVPLAMVRPETALMYAVLEHAFLCFQRRFEMERRCSRHAARAEEWFNCDDSHWLFSFVSICIVLGLDRKFIRQRLKHWRPSPMTRHREKCSVS